MSDSIVIPAIPQSFFEKKTCKILPIRRYIVWGFLSSIIQFTLFKLLYPYPDFFSDSYSYIFAAYAHLDVSIWPIGYSKFLSLLHAITYSDNVLVTFQYFFLQAAAGWFFLTIISSYAMSSINQKLLFTFLFVNPLSLYLSNTITSDCLFTAFSLLWLSTLVHVILRPRIYQVFPHAFLLFLCFTIRNNAYYYPLIAIIAFLLSKQNVTTKLIGIGLPFLFIVPFIIHTQNAALKITGTRQFSLFTGWQLANNALYVYDQVTIDSNDIPTPQAKELNRLSIAFFKTVRPEVYRDYLEAYVGNFFIREPNAPLKQYFIHHYPIKNSMEVIAAWGAASAVFEPFGKYIILHHPLAYVRFFMWPNIWRYFLPPLSHLEKYNYGIDNIDPIAQIWFHYRVAKIHCFSNGFQSFLIVYSALFLLLNLYFIWKLILLLKERRRFIQTRNLMTFWLMTSFLVCNFSFSLFATVNILRYQIVPMIILITYTSWINDYLERKNSSKTITASI